ncbi:hypothetical protein BGP76_16030 [Reichenbachiella sp. MSK19-1]|nr:hypothetical protein BGP76_16030 [Reichenbachiella sp. MSK19-1]
MKINKNNKQLMLLIILVDFMLPRFCSKKGIIFSSVKNSSHQFFCFFMITHFQMVHPWKFRFLSFP